MSEGKEGRAERVAKYKEERRRQLAAQYGSNTYSDPSTNRNNGKDTNSSSSEGPRTTRASRLRAAAAQENSSQISAKPAGNGIRQVERDKSSKRKSNLNRALNSEEVPSHDADDIKNRRRRRRFFPQEVFEQTTNNSTTKSDTSVTASFLPSTSPITASSISPRSTPRKSELSIHMENARKGKPPSYSEMGKYKPLTKRAVASSPKETLKSETKNSPNRETIKTSEKNVSSPDYDFVKENRSISKKMEELTALTRATLARVENLASKTLTNKRRDEFPKHLKSSSPIKQLDTHKTVRNVHQPSSILKKKLIEETIHHQPESVPNTTAPVSILKRKVSQDDKHEGASSSTHTPPVTFSPSVVEPTTSARKQGILKKRRSLDESQVMRHRSCSPDVANKTDARSILKNQRRSSMEELTRTQSPELHLHGILKRKTSRVEDEDHSLNSPQSILKRRSGASSAGSTGSTPHVSITTAVILAAAGGAEMVLESETVKPILKKKSFSEEHSYSEGLHTEVPRPILKKKSSTDTDEYDEKPKPILKTSKNSIDRDHDFKHAILNGDECEFKPILKQKDEGLRPRLSFRGGAEGDDDDSSVTRRTTARRSNTICADFNLRNQNFEAKEGDRNLKKPRPLSVSELVMSFENNASTGAIPKRSMKRVSDRYRTQPVTSNELEASLNFVRSPQLETTPKLSKSSPLSSPNVNRSVSSLLDLTSSLENDSNLNSFFQTTSPSICGKMSSDSAFQSLGDGLELDQDEKSPEDPKQTKFEPKKLELQMKAIAEEAKRMKLGKSKLGIQSYRNRRPIPGESSSSSRFSTQPVTFEEVQTASRINNKSDDSEDEEGSERNVERRGILKSSSFRTDSQPRSSLVRKRDSFERLKPEILDVTYDEGISCNDSASDSEIATVPLSCGKSSEFNRLKNVDEYIRKSNSGDTTSDGESSGGREIQSIFKNESKLRVKQALESVLSRSKSQGAFGDETDSTDRKGTSIRRSQTQAAMPRTIAEIQAKLQQSGESAWKRRAQQNNNSNDELKLLKDRNRYNNELSEKSILAVKKDELDAAAKQWRQRVEKSDAEKFSVAGRMEKEQDLSVNIPTGDKHKRIPQAKRFKGKEGTDSSSTPVSPDKSRYVELTRTYSVPEPDQDFSGSDTSLNASGRKVSITRPDDFTFKNFYKSVDVEKSKKEHVEVSLDDFDAVSRETLLVQKKNIQVQKRRGASKNPVKALALREDISSEYTEVITGVAEREKRRLNIEKLSKNSNLAVEALAGLASKEDFKSVNLKKSAFSYTMVPFKDIMLLQVKGRRHIQTRLVEPVAASINEGDNFILVTSKVIFSYVGAYSNVIESSRAADILNNIQQTGDLGCKEVEVVTLDSNNLITSKHINKFWKILGCDEKQSFAKAGHPDEDEIYESNIIATNMIYGLDGNELVPLDQYWGTIPKFEMLESSKVFVFDFGSEMYVWSGKTAPLDKKKLSLKLAKELWDQGYDYSECNVCPLNVASILGDRSLDKVALINSQRPEWALFAKITQHRETILFKEKFLDWPDFSRVIRVKGDEVDKTVDPSYNISACDVQQMMRNENQPDLIIENYHLGRGNEYFDEETKRLFVFDTLDVSVWRILENNSEKLSDESIKHFYDSDSYIIRWTYRMTVKGRELSGKPSKYAQVGRDKSIYFCWQGLNASINEKGLAALLTVELDSERAPQVRVVQGAEPAAFLRLFNGSIVVHKGKRDEPENPEKPRLFMIRGELQAETSLIEVPCATRSLRSRTSFILIDCESEEITIWHGIKSSKQNKRVIKKIVEKIVEEKAAEFYLDNCDHIEVHEVEEGNEDEFLNTTGRNRADYFSLLDSYLDYDFTIRLFYFSSVSGTFKVTEILCPHRSEHSSPYPFLQNDLYSASQPALFLIDNHHELWLWQGWWPEREEDLDSSDQTGSGAVRWQAERKAAMQTAVDYWRKNHIGDDSVPAYLVWAGLEPLEFKNLFPCWIDREDIAELNLKEGKKPGGKLLLEQELAKLSRTTYPLSQIMQRPLPEGVDPTHLEIYLSSEDFQELLNMSREEFQKLPLWKQTAIKKEKGLF